MAAAVIPAERSSCLERQHRQHGDAVERANRPAGSAHPPASGCGHVDGRFAGWRTRRDRLRRQERYGCGMSSRPASSRSATLGGQTINAVAFATAGRSFRDAWPPMGTPTIWDVDKIRREGAGSRGLVPEATLQVGAERVWAVAVSPDDSQLLTAGGDEAQIWDLRSGRGGMTFARQGSVAAARFSPDSQRVITGSWDNTARIWNAATGVVELRLVGHSGYVNDAIFSPSGRQVLTASDDRTARTWDAKTGEPRRRFEGHQEGVRTAVFSPNEDRVLTASNDKTARIWDAADRRAAPRIAGHDQAVLVRGVLPRRHARDDRQRRYSRVDLGRHRRRAAESLPGSKVTPRASTRSPSRPRARAPSRPARIIPPSSGMRGPATSC